MGCSMITLEVSVHITPQALVLYIEAEDMRLSSLDLNKGLTIENEVL